MTHEYKTCKKVGDLYELMHQEKYPLAEITPSQVTKLKVENARDAWRQIQEKFGQLLKEQGHVDVGKNNEGKLVIKTGKPGKPALLERNKECRVTIRLDEKTNRELEEYCDKHKLSKANVIRFAIRERITEPKEGLKLKL